jgi:quercetin dioxygenase-like cupin family protein
VHPATPTTIKSATGASCNKPFVKTASAPVEQAKAKGYMAQILAMATVNALPTGTLYASVVEVPQPGGTTITHEHTAGFVYVIDGTQELVIKGGDTVTLAPGKASFISTNIIHSHINLGKSVNHWYFVSLRPNTARHAPPLFPNQKVLYATPDLPPLPTGVYCESLILSTHQPGGGRTPAHIHSGLEVNIVLDGTIQFIMARQTMMLTAGQGMYHLPNTPIQGVNEGTGIAHHLTLLVWPQGQPIRTDLNYTP